MTETYVYKLLTAADWAIAEAEGAPRTALDVGDGYVHLSTKSQINETAQLYYNGAAGAQLIEFAVADLPPLKWEASRGGQLFPHLYAPLEVAKASRQWTLALDDDGAPIMPQDLGGSI